ncbi:hypothetical protein COT98_02070 [Candidatus Falkowbacteria bacterium CG10_big_fil_rev_8_21_14_0_10_39_9]|uniref:Permease n=1 Tax=Candidatus Falkowbacteria bacterium CG10_big_fil_rev_8_21_14_0_10_39_9 TaxID=1974566 RepID=A0A2M6WPT3_9BACT|nr:MAG: hypothetical protein COT98_02070 [Candidatus Falkowbacteria bacterium CG10_big_fil_rev_8_21_14_0_10_39_9]
MTKKYIEKIKPYVWLASFAVFSVGSFWFGFNPGKTIYQSFTKSFIEMITFIPFLFIIVGLFDVWFPKEKIEKHVGKDSGIKGIIMVVILAMLQVGPLYGAFPVAYILYKKGASIKNIFIYLGAFSTLKIPMLGIEIGYLGLNFTLVRTLVSLPLFIAVGYFMEWYLKNRNFKVNEV